MTGPRAVPLDPIRAWIHALPEDAIAQVVRAYHDAEWEGPTPEGDAYAVASQAFRDALLSLAPRGGAVSGGPDTSQKSGVGEGTAP